MVYTHNGVFFSHKEEMMSFVGKWMELETIMLNELSQPQKVKYHVFNSCGV
jgi:hypothetical protein